MAYSKKVCYYEGYCLYSDTSQQVKVIYADFVPYAGMPNGGVKVLDVCCPHAEECPHLNECKIDKEAEDYLQTTTI